MCYYHQANIDLFENYSTEIVDPKTLNLQDEYQKLNKLLFNGELQPVEMKWEVVKHCGGRVVGTRMKRMVGRQWKPYGPTTIQYLGMSTYMQLTYQKFVNILAHEMIHVYMIQNNINDLGYHGPLFKNHMDKINKRGLGITISIFDTYTIEEIQLSDNEPLKKPLAAIIVRESDSPKITFIPLLQSVSSTIFQDFISTRAAYMAHVKKQDLKFELIETTDPKTKLYKASRLLKSAQWILIKDDQLADMMKMGKVIQTVNVGRDDYKNDMAKKM